MNISQMTVADRKRHLVGDVPRETLDAFNEYKTKHPEIYPLFKKYAEEMRATGRKRYSAKSIMERIRWDHDINRIKGEFKISNSFTSLYARFLILNEPSFQDFFQLKHLRGLTLPS